MTSHLNSLGFYLAHLSLERWFVLSKEGRGDGQACGLHTGEKGEKGELYMEIGSENGSRELSEKVVLIIIVV